MATPSRRCVTALTADGAFLEFRGTGRVEQVFSRAVNLFIPELQRLFTLLSESGDNAPNSCRLALTHCEDLFHPGEPVSFTETGIAVGTDKWIATSGCQTWQMPSWSPDPDRFAAISWRCWAEVIRQQLNHRDTLFLYQGDNPFYQEIARELQNRRRALIAALNNGENISFAVGQLIGLGIGLTPSSDDYLVGLSTVLFINGHPLKKHQHDFLAALRIAGNNTTLLSKITLEEAFHQRYRESVARLVTHIITRQHHVATPFITDIKNIGSSSGCDMLYGMADACTLSHRSGGNYVDQDSC
ncbi:DUF2877 domain-containing protein [Citrobacter freundii]|uniref:DUF2877 domain-containing protein n=1 Tax=Citrobacter freundii TaxID=546 RepID=UPI0015E9DF3F|nr:DUF2877 domain-containing protein [Citrobacter freundii]QLR75183.1 DUF2877 domain-containing protein [Citrobacter freundii]QLY54401.1 DUF2877 domain-containing protein [Citrobacter freundii]